MKIIPINKYEDTRGSLSVLASYGREDAPEMSKIEEVYFAEIPKRGTVRAGHKHDKTEEFWTGNYIFENEWQSFRTKYNKKIELVSSKKEIHNSKTKIAVKVVDIFGNDTMKTMEVKL